MKSLNYPSRLSKVLLNLINNKYETESLDFRLVASTSKDLKSYVSLRLFLDDLFHRISIEEIHIPSLIDRKEDIPPLVRYFIDDYASTTEILHNLTHYGGCACHIAVLFVARKYKRTEKLHRKG